MMRFRRAIVVLGLGLGLFTPGLSTSAAPSAPPIQVLIRSDGTADSAASDLREILLSTGRFQVRTVETSARLSATMLLGVDLVVDDVAADYPDAATVDALAHFVRLNKGLVVTRRAIRAGRDRSIWPVVFDPVEPPTKTGIVAIQLDLPEHPIVRGMASGLRIADSVALGIQPTGSGEVIASSANRDPILLADNVGQGRSIGLAIGTDRSARHEPAFQALFARSCEWAATRAVTLPPALNSARPVDPSVRALLITGGHDHDAAFYGLFLGDNDLGSLPVLTSADAFKVDIRGKYDVVIMYDFSRTLPEPSQKNLRDFVEAGGGVVVLHHALLNYQDWTWWTDEAVGGSYRLTRPSSKVKNDQQIEVMPTPGQPITAGIAPFHIEDEAYKDLRYSAQIRPLLTTDNPTSDHVLAWLSPLGNARVVAIQLGHGRTAFDHPSYRQIVHNAILWAAGKLK